MAKIERRNGADRRRNDRHKVSIPVEWESVRGRLPGSINDLSITGCFVLSGGEVDDGEEVKIIFPVSQGKVVEIPAEIVNHVFEVGFAARFLNLTDKHIVFIHRLMERVANS